MKRTNRFRLKWNKGTVHMTYPTITAADILERREEVKARFIIDWGLDIGNYKDRLVDEIFGKHIFPVVGRLNLFQTVAAFQPGR